MLDSLKGGLIVSCYASKTDANAEMADPSLIALVARAVEMGGAAAVRTTLENVKAIKSAVSVPVIGIKKVSATADGFDSGDFRITPTMTEVGQLLAEGADAVAIDGTRRKRYDELTLDGFIQKIKEEFGCPVIADISTFEEGVAAYKAGADAVGTTLAGYTPYSDNPIKFGTVPSPPPDFKIVRRLAEQGICVIAEGRYNAPEQAAKALAEGAHAVVVGTAITMPRKIAEKFVYEMKKVKLR